MLTRRPLGTQSPSIEVVQPAIIAKPKAKKPGKLAYNKVEPMPQTILDSWVSFAGVPDRSGISDTVIKALQREAASLGIFVDEAKSVEMHGFYLKLVF